MRTVNWLVAVSVVLFVLGIAFIVAGARTLRQPAAAVVTAQTTPVATVKQIMNAVTAPAATVVYDSVATIVDAKGIHEFEPRTDEEWAKLATSAAALAESGNLLILPGRSVDEGDWNRIARELTATATKAVKAADAKDKQAILAAGGEINETCDNCHAKYQR
jgi:hypothetical protein